MSDGHVAIVTLDAIIVAVTVFGSIYLNVRYNRVEPYFMRGWVMTRLVGVAAGLVCFLSVYALSRFW